VTFTGPNGALQGAWAAATSPRGSVLVIHENRGLTDHIRSVAGRLAASGCRYNPSAAAAAFQKLLEWFGTHLA
jgi:dienelactone hydrolase